VQSLSARCSKSVHCPLASILCVVTHSSNGGEIQKMIKITEGGTVARVTDASSLTHTSPLTKKIHSSRCCHEALRQKIGDLSALNCVSPSRSTYVRGMQWGRQIKWGRQITYLPRLPSSLLLLKRHLVGRPLIQIEITAKRSICTHAPCARERTLEHFVQIRLDQHAEVVVELGIIGAVLVCQFLHLLFKVVC